MYKYSNWYLHLSCLYHSLNKFCGLIQLYAELNDSQRIFNISPRFGYLNFWILPFSHKGKWWDKRYYVLSCNVHMKKAEEPTIHDIQLKKDGEWSDWKIVRNLGLKSHMYKHCQLLLIWLTLLFGKMIHNL